MIEYIKESLLDLKNLISNSSISYLKEKSLKKRFFDNIFKQEEHLGINYTLRSLAYLVISIFIFYYDFTNKRMFNICFYAFITLLLVYIILTSIRIYLQKKRFNLPLILGYIENIFALMMILFKYFQL